MFKYLNLLDLDIFKSSLHIFKRYYEDKPKYSILLSTNILMNFKCGAPKHLFRKYLYKLKKEELLCEHSRCTDNKECTCVETPYNNTIRTNCNNLQITHMPFIYQYSSKL